MANSGPLKWHGGKAYFAARFVALMPPHVHYVEPYFGGGAVLLAKNPEGVSEVVNDLNGDLAHFWQVLRSPDAFGAFHRRCEATAFDETAYDHAAEYLRSNPPAGPGVLNDYRAWAFFVACRQSLAGRMKGFAGIVRTRTRRGMSDNVSAWLGAVEGLPAVHERLKRVLILHRPALDVIRSEDGPQMLFYLDPPYLHETRATTGEYGKYEMTEADHVLLLDVLAGLQGRFMLSGYRSELYDLAAERHGWRRLDFDAPNQAAGGKTKRRMTECLWMNFQP